MNLAKKVKARPRLPLYAWVRWSCGDITQHEVLSQTICSYSLQREYELANSYGPIWKRWYEIDTISNSTNGSRGWNVAPEWTSGEGECGVRPTTRKTTK